MRLSYYITAVLLWVGMLVSLIAFRSSRHSAHSTFLMLFFISGIAASLIALILAFSRREVAVGFAALGILHGVTLPFILWPATTQSPGLGLVIPALAICIGLRAIIMMRKRA